MTGPAERGAARGVAWMAASSLFYALTYVTVRELSATFPAVEIAFFRAVLGMAAMLPWAVRAGPAGLRTGRAKLYGVRALVTYSGMVCWFYGLAHLPLAAATALMFVAPFFTVMLLAAGIGERVGARRWGAIAAGFVGALAILRPGLIETSLATLALCYVAVAYGAANAATRALALTENANAVVFYQFALVVPLAALPAALDWVSPGPADAAMILAFGILSLISMQCMTRALALAPAGVTAPLFYLQLPLTALLAFACYGEIPDVWVWVGSAAICGSGWFVVHTETRRRSAGREASS